MITIVKFYAFNRPQTEVFYSGESPEKALLEEKTTPQKSIFYKGETPEQIHAVLFEICATYVPIEIITCPKEYNVPLDTLTSLQAAAPAL